jgi:hypothetical protein
MAGLGTDFFPVFYKLGGGTPTPPQVEFYALRVDFPAVGVVDVIYVAQDESLAYIWDAALVVYAPLGNDGIEWYSTLGIMPYPGKVDTLYVGKNEALVYIWDAGLSQYVSTAHLTYFTESQAFALAPSLAVASTLKATAPYVGNSHVCVVPKGVGGFMTAVPDNTAVGGASRGNYSVDLQLSRASAASVAGGAYCFIGGGYNNGVDGNYSVVSGGQANGIIAGTSGVIGGGNNNILQTGSDGCVIGGGLTNKVDVTYITAATIGGGADNRANSSHTAVCGGLHNTIGTTSQYSTIVGGYYSNITNSAQYSFIGGGRNTLIQASYATIAGGDGNNIGVGGTYGFIGGGVANGINVNASYSAILGGANNTISARYSAVIGSDNSIASEYSVALGRAAGGSSRVSGALYFSSGTPNGFTGQNQTIRVTPYALSTSATPVKLTTKGAAATDDRNTYVLPNNSMAKFVGTVLVRSTVAANYAIFEFNGYVKRDANAASTVMLIAPTVTLVTSGGTGATWALGVTANTTLGCVELTGTGGAAENLTWFSEMKFIVGERP